jgi:hypothetical protein
MAQVENHMAPSEKHLEDYLWAYPEALGRMEVYSDLHQDSIFKFKWQQLPVASGIVDLVGTEWDQSLAIVELKRRLIDTKAFAQIMRYLHDFQQILYHVIRQYCMQDKPYQEYVARHPLVHGTWETQLLRGVLIGRECTDKNLLTACEAARIDVYSYKYQDGHYQFTQKVEGKRTSTQIYGANVEASSQVNDLLQELVANDLCIEEEIKLRERINQYNKVAAKLGREYRFKQAIVPTGDDHDIIF